MVPPLKLGRVVVHSAKRQTKKMWVTTKYDAKYLRWTFSVYAD
jgi:hypothetical protein